MSAPIHAGYRPVKGTVIGRLFRSLSAVIGISLLFGSVASAQTPSNQSAPQAASATSASDESSRPATTTFFGDTGVWFVPTAEYNLALGDRSSSAVREYLVSRGISADRLRTVSYGEERPKHDNAREETRRFNRRAALVVSLQQ